MATVTINSVNYDSYEDVAGADTYLAARVGSAGVWDGTPTPSVDEKGRALVTATRWILEYIRGRVADADLVLPSAVTISQFLQDACSELAYALVVDSSIQDNANTGSNTRRVKAGSAEVEFFRPTSGKPFPERAQVLLNAWLDEVGTVASSTAATVSGTGTSVSDFCDRDEFGVTTPLD